MYPGREKPKPEKPIYLPRERFTSVEEDDSGNWSVTELPEVIRDELMRKTSAKVRREVRKAHRGLGHPNRTVPLRMLRLGGASPAAMLYARHWVRRVCAVAAAPGAPASS